MSNESSKNYTTRAILYDYLYFLSNTSSHQSHLL